MQALWKFGGDILDAMNSEVSPFFKERFLNLLDKKAFPSDLR
jgi:hypothetical protein